MHDQEPSDVATPATDALAAGLVGLLASLLSLRSIANSDFWLHLAAGRHMATHGLTRLDPFSFATDGKAQWVQDTWLYDVLLHTVWRWLEAPGVVLLNTLMAGLAFAAMARLGRVRRGPALLAGGLALWLAAPQMVVRPTLPALALAAITIWAVRQSASRGRLLAGLIPLQIIWTNIHPTFLLGPALAVLAALEHSLGGRSGATPDAAQQNRARSRDRMLVAGVMLAATLINPFGLRAHVQALRQFARPAEGWMLEWISPYASLFDPGWLGALPTLVLGLIALGFVLHRQRLPWFESVLGVISAFLIVWVPQHIEWCALLALPFLALSIHAMVAALERCLPDVAAAWVRPASVLAGLALWLASALALTTSAYYRDTGSGSRFGWTVQQDLFPFAAAQQLLQAPGFPPRVYNLPLDGGALLWAQPHRKVLVDARTPVYGHDFLRDLNLALRGDQDRWNEITTRVPGDAFVFNCCWNGAGSIIRSLLMSRQWTVSYFDGTTAVLIPALRRNLVWMRRGPIQQAGLDRLEAARQAYSDAVERGQHPPNPNPLIGAAAFLQSVGQFREAASLYSLLARGSPQMTGAWLNLGICLVQRGDPAQATPILEYTRTRIPKHVMVHLWLSRAYRETGRGDEADAAYARAVRLDRQVAEAFAGLAAPNRPARVPASAAPLPDR